MQRFFSYKINFLFGAVVIVAMAWNIYNIFFSTAYRNYQSKVYEQGDKIFY